MAFFNSIYVKWFILQLRCRIRSASFILLLLIMLITAGLIRNVFDRAKDVLMIPVVVDNSDAGAEVAGYLTGIHDKNEGISRICFFQVTDVSELVKNVTRGKYCCGIVFDGEFDKKLKMGQTDRLIKFYQSSDSAEGYLVKEVVFSCVFRKTGGLVLSGYMDENEKELSMDVRQKILHGNERYLDENGLKVFSTEWIGEGNNSVKASLDPSDLAFSAVFAVISLIGIFEAFSENRSFLAVHSAPKRFVLSAETVLAVLLINVAAACLFW